MLRAKNAATATTRRTIAPSTRTTRRRPRRRAEPRRERFDGLGAVLAGAGAVAVSAVSASGALGRTGAWTRAGAALAGPALADTAPAGPAFPVTTVGWTSLSGPGLARMTVAGPDVSGPTPVLARPAAAAAPAAIGALAVGPAPDRAALRRALRSGLRERAPLPRPPGLAGGARLGSRSCSGRTAVAAASTEAVGPDCRWRRTSVSSGRPKVVGLSAESCRCSAGVQRCRRRCGDG